MRGRVKAVLFGFLLLSSSLSADCTWTPRASAQFRTTAFDLSVDGNSVWLATGYGVQLLQGTDVVASVALPGSTRVVVANGSGLAWGGSGSRVYVLRRDGNRIIVSGSADAGAAVNDAVLALGDLFVATANGIAHFDLLDGGATLARTNATLNTSSPSVLSLAVAGNTLYAADGDSSVETFSVAGLPQATGALAAMPRASAVHTAPDGFVYVSDRFSQTTEVFSGATLVATVPFPALSFAGSASRVHYVAGRDLTLRAVDFSQPSRAVELFEAPFAATDGNENAMHAIERAGNMLYVAAGDAGFAAIDVSLIARPYPLASYATGATTSVVAEGTKAWFADAAGRISEQTVDPAGISLTEARAWNTAAGTRLRDVRGNRLLTTSGATATVWDLAAATPAPAPVTFADTIVHAVLGESSVVVLLSNASVYRVAANGQPEKLNVPKMNLLARGGPGIAATEIREEEGKTVLHYWPAGDPALEAQRFELGGAAVTMALDATRAAVFTFAGISVVDLASGAVRVIPRSDIPPRQLAFAGDDLVVLDSRRLFVYGDASVLEREQPLTAEGAAVAGSGTVAVLATNEGVAAVSAVTSLPRATAPFANNYYTKVVAGGDRVYLFSRSGVDVFSTATAAPLRYVTGLRVPGLFDVAATGDGVFTLSVNGTVSAFSPRGALLLQRVLPESDGPTMLSLHAVGGALWLSTATGCIGCPRRTLVLDPATLATTAVLEGSVRDVAVTGNRAWALFELPGEVRAFDLTDPLEPAQIASTPSPTLATSLAQESTRLHVAGDRIYTYSSSTLEPAGQQLAAVTPDDGQRIRIAGDCAIVTGRTASPELYTVPAWTAASGFELPSAVRSVALQEGRVIFLTGHSVEIWTTLPPPPAPARRRSVR